MKITGIEVGFAVKLFLRALIAVIIAGAGGISFAQELATPLENDKSLILIERFEGSGDNGNQSLKLYHSSIVAQGKNGNALNLSKGSYAELNPAKLLSASAGTISFWVYPMWDRNDTKSHTFLTMRWGDDKKSYLAISQGWWEPDGTNRLYFILSNQEYMHCSEPYSLEIDAWSMVTVTWRAGKKGFCRLYVNSDRIADLEKQFSGTYESINPVFLGSDKGATDQRGRGALCLMDDLIIYDRTLAESEIRNTFQQQGGDMSLVYQRKWKWLNDGLKAPLRQKRDERGKLLESRVIFDESITWATSREETNKVLNRIKAAGFNVYVPCVWHGQGTYYQTALTSPDTRLQKIIDDEYDPLTYLIKQAHSLGIEVHPWFTVALRYDKRYPQFFDEGTPENAYNIHNKDFRKFIIDLMLDVVQRYNVDGINLDYIRTMGICTSSACRDDYFIKTGFPFHLDFKMKDMFGAARTRIQKWQDDAVGEVVSDFAKRARNLKPNLVISIDGHVEIDDAVRSLQGRNELKWENRRWIDVIFNMDYQARIDFEKITFAQTNLSDRKKLVLLFGNYEHEDDLIVSRPGDIVAKYIEFAQRTWPGTGVALYLYTKLSDEQIKGLKSGVFKEDADPYWPCSKTHPVHLNE
jgi:Glycosyl hydrolase-like 10/Concanavalin A-like lectin/glucanases superfamily